jgi:hypothetical protein
MSVMRSILLTLVLSVIGAAIGAWGGAEYVMHHAHAAPSLHEVVHQKLHLTAEQEGRMAGLERDHATRRHAFEAEMRAANADLAQAFQEQHAYTPQVQAAIDRFHHAMGGLQKETIVHVLAMRSVLTPEQTAQFDQTVVKSLTEDAR